MRGMFNSTAPRPTQKGSAGYDNARENIDPKIITRVILAKTLYGQITLAAQPNITSLGTLTTLNIVSGGKIGIGTTSPTYDIGFDNSSNHKIMNETTTNIVAGKELEIRSGTAGNTSGTPAFVDLVTGTKNWIGMAAAPNGNVYACVNNGSIWMQTGGVGAFVDLGTGNKNWFGMTAAPNGNVYASVYGGSIWMQTGGVGAFVDLVTGNKNWRGMAAAPNGNVYACVNGGSIWMQTGGVGAFVDLVTGTKNWRGMAAAPNGDVYASVYNGGSIWMQTGGVGAFVDLVTENKNWYGMAAAPNGNVYACVYGGSIWMQAGTLGTINLSGGNLILSSGKGKGTGVSNVSIFTGTTLASGYTMQTLSEKITVIGNGNMGIGTTTPNEKLQVVGNISTNGNVELATISVAAVPGIDAVIVTAALTALGSQGSMTFSKGILTAQTPAT